MAGLLSPYSDAEEVDDEKMVEERSTEVIELDEMLAEQESMEASSRLDDDSNLVLYQSHASELRSEQTGLTPGMRTMIVSVGESTCDSNSRWV